MWSHIWTFLLKNVKKWPPVKYVFMDFFFFIYSLLRNRLSVFLSPLPSQIWTFLAQESSKMAAAKQLFYRFFFLFSLHLNVVLPSLSEVQCPNFSEFLNPWGTLIERRTIVSFISNSLPFYDFSPKDELIIFVKTKTLWWMTSCIPSSWMTHLVGKY